MSTDQRQVPSVTVSIPNQRQDDADVLGAGPDLEPSPTEPFRSTRLLLGGVAVVALVAVALTDAPPWASAPAAPVLAEPVSLALMTPAPSATARPRQGEAPFVTLRLRVALRNDSASWVSLTGATLGPYRAAGDGLGALAPGALTSLPLERLVVCDSPALGSAPRFLEVDVLGPQGPTQIHLALSQPAGTDPTTVVPACT